MIGHHVAQRAGGVVKLAPAADVHRFGCGDLDVIDEIGAPDGGQDGVGEARDDQVLDGFLAEEMIDPVDLVFFGAFEQFGVERLCRGKIGAEGFLDDDAAEAAPLIEQVRVRQLVREGFEIACRRGEVENRIVEAAFGDRGESGGIVEIALEVRYAAAQLRITRIGGHILAECVAQPLVVDIVMRDTEDVRIGREQSRVRQVDDGGHQQAACEIAISPEDDERGGGRAFRLRGCGGLCLRSVGCRVFARHAVAHCGIST